MNQNKELYRRNELIEEYQDYVQGIVGIMVQSMGLPSKHFDEFVAAGCLGLVEAASRFDFDSGREFKYFAFLRIRGAVIDSIRETADVSGKAYRHAKALQAANEFRECQFEVEAESDEKPSDDEQLASVLESAAAGLMAYRLTINDAEEEITEIGENPHDPEKKLLEVQKNKKIRQILATLPEKERLVIEDFYFKDKSFVEIAEEYEGMSKSWISRLHAKALLRLQEAFSTEEIEP